MNAARWQRQPFASHAAALAEHAEKLGADAVISVPVIYYSAPAQVPTAHFKTIARW